MGEILNYLKKIGYTLFVFISLLFFLEWISSAIDLEYDYYANDLPLSSEYRHFYEKGDLVQLKKKYTGTLRKSLFALRKDPDSFRIMILGGSSVYNLELSFLRDRVSRFFPNKNVEILNLGGNSYGTTRLLLLAKEVVKYRPDLVILYSGHNEYEEMFINDKLLQEGGLHKLRYNLYRRFALFRALQYATEVVITSLGKEVVEYGNKGANLKIAPEVHIEDINITERAAVYLNYKMNLVLIVRIFLKLNIPIILNSVAFNREVPPGHDSRGTYKRCNDISDYSRRLRCYEESLEFDGLPHRSSLDGNAIAKEVAKEYGTYFVDVDNLLRKMILSKNITYNEVFYDHCHINDYYNKNFLEKIWFEKIKQIYR